MKLDTQNGVLVAIAETTHDIERLMDIGKKKIEKMLSIEPKNGHRTNRKACPFCTKKVKAMYHHIWTQHQAEKVAQGKTPPGWLIRKRAFKS